MSRNGGSAPDDIFRSFGFSRPGVNLDDGIGGMSSDGGSTRDGIFSDFFGFPGGSRSTNPSSRSMFNEDIFSQFRGAAGGAKGSASMPSRKAAAIERTLPCSLEDLYKGTTKKMKISRDVVDLTGKSTTIEEILTIDIKPGWKKGTKIIFSEKGNELQGVIPSDLVFVIDEKPHPVFQRDGNDLVVIKKIFVTEALTGYTVQLSTLDGRSLTIPINSVISPTYEEVVKGEGMPISKEPTKKGNLRVKFNIKYPTRLTSEQKTGIKQLFPSS